MDFEIITTDRLYLRKLTDETFEALLKNASDEIVVQILAIRPEDLGKERAKAKKGFGTFNKSLLIFQLIDKQSDAVIGWCGYHTWYRDHNRAEIGYGMSNEAVKAKGFMTEALAKIIDYGFAEMQLNRIEAMISPENVPSLKLVEKFGFTREGHLRSHYFKDGKYEDSLVFSLLKTEYGQ
ncbi:GNAT family N-acetyltransferase [Flavobacterium sp.]|uniref:GNAT family N-acetyltransferase n=1 Tax=Flavobacterium sp. TaxID=239 RepID=UPI0039E359A9